MADKGTIDPAVDLMERAIAQLTDVIAAIRPEQAGLPTPCEDWHVRRLIKHLLGQILPNFVIAAQGGTPDWQATDEEFGDIGWGDRFATGSAPLLAAWRIADLDSKVPALGGAEMPLRGRADQQITEFAMHAWDLVRVTDQQRDLDPELAEYGLAWSKQVLKPEYRGAGKAFGLEVPISEDAPAYDRLAAWFGRDPRWKP
ncbi:TIGR03086 family metal-binding protein [Nocardia crassostreae]|uniref:TIGR03086 family metal-binding protein n=1 Tax=Nocardia crassostreae TaxID=53428 RepID=UPI00082CFDB2|nr:TIGR03086 family metal-binding protein [Nocardia crassostreae]